ncbi:MAG: hypothetical protein ABJA81_03150 [Nocardioidaceae bacterium]
MSLSQRGAARSTDAEGSEGFGGPFASSPAARRLQTHRWRDPRLWIGGLLVVCSVLIGAKLLASADDTVAIWAVDDDISAGMTIGAVDVHAVRIHFSNAADADRYLSAGQAWPDEAIATKDFGAGELLSVSGITTDNRAVPDELPLGVAADGLPADLRSGDHVDVWAVPSQGSSSHTTVSVLRDVTVVSVGERGPGGLESTREVLVALPPEADVARVLGSLRDASVVLVRIGG